MKKSKRTYLADDDAVERRVTDGRSNAKAAALRKYYRDKETELKEIEQTTVETTKKPENNE